MRRMDQHSIYLDPAQTVAPRALSERTRVPMSIYIREAVSLLLERYAKEQREFGETDPPEAA